MHDWRQKERTIPYWNRARLIMRWRLCHFCFAHPRGFNRWARAWFMGCIGQSAQRGGPEHRPDRWKHDQSRPDERQVIDQPAFKWNHLMAGKLIVHNKLEQHRAFAWTHVALDVSSQEIVHSILIWKADFIKTMLFQENRMNIHKNARLTPKGKDNTMLKPGAIIVLSLAFTGPAQADPVAAWWKTSHRSTCLQVKSLDGRQIDRSQ